MISVRLFGGLGNQMFQYAVAVALSEHRRESLELQADSVRPVLVAELSIPNPVRSKTYQPRSLSERVRRRLRLPQRGVFKERFFHFDPAVFELPSGMTLDGYFQSWRYFVGFEELLRARFAPKQGLSDAGQEALEHICSTRNSVSMHVRRGDYLTPHAQLVHGSLPDEYYRRAIDVVHALIGPEITLFVFSDDPEWVRTSMRLEGDVHILSGAADRACEDMVLMSACEHHIIANSSYSWWGAWLNSNPDKLVVAPRQWFTPEALRFRNTCDLCPAEWVML